jgi:hypothetical protein
MTGRSDPAGALGVSEACKVRSVSVTRGIVGWPPADCLCSRTDGAPSGFSVGSSEREEVAACVRMLVEGSVAAGGVGGCPRRSSAPGRSGAAAWRGCMNASAPRPGASFPGRSASTCSIASIKAPETPGSGEKKGAITGRTSGATPRAFSANRVKKSLIPSPFPGRSVGALCSWIGSQPLSNRRRGQGNALHAAGVWPGC